MLRIRFVVTALLILGLADPACPVTSPFPEAPFSMGQPRRITASWGPSFGYVIEDDEFEWRLNLSVTGEAFFPQFGFAQLTFEGTLAGRSETPEWLLAGYAKVPWIRAGLEYRSKARDFVPAFSVMVVPRRGGLLGLGDVLRVDYRPHNQTVLLGITIRQPFVRYRRTRPTHEYTRIPRGRVSSKNPALKVFPLTAQLSRRIEEVEHAMLWLDRLLIPCFEFGEDFVPDAGAYRGHIRKQGHTFLEEDATYHQGLSDAFALAVDGDVEQGDILAQKAEAVLLQRVVIPFNRLFGQNKWPHRLGGYTQAALQEFESHLAQERHFSRLDPHVADRQLAHAREIFRRVLRQLDRVSKNSRDRWFQSYLFWLYQSRLVWLPLNYGLRPEQYDTQEEWDRIMEQLTRKRFTHTNDISYLVNEQFHTELKRMIRETEAYHILWLHDFRGQHGKGRTDVIGWDLVVDGYIPALIQAILDMDAGRRNTFPQFMIFLDELYYQENRSRQIITFLENIGNHKEIELQDKRVQGRVRAAQRHLLSLAQNSSALASLDRDELRDLLKVHVSVTNPHDPAFTADATIRDHRKISFRDVFERDPGLGEAIFTGKGVGEHYSGSGWEDRSILVRGPALLDLKVEAQRLLISQGFRASELPPYLKGDPFPADYDNRCRQLLDRGWNSSVLLVMNDTGYGKKECTVLKAAVYNLAVPGSVLFSYDSLWISEFWAGMLISAALRGVKVYTIAPTPDHAPSSAKATLVLMRETQDQLFRAREYFETDIGAAGGSLRTGFYALEPGVSDPRGRIEAFLDGIERNQFVLKEFPIHDVIVEALRGLKDRTVVSSGDTMCDVPPQIQCNHKPFLHLKAQYYTTKEVFEALSMSEWATVAQEYHHIRDRQIRGCPTPSICPDILRWLPLGHQPGRRAVNRQLDSAANVSTNPWIQSWLIGSQNQDRRGMLLDGEVMVAISGFNGLISLPDFLFLLFTATWPETHDEFARSFPEAEELGILKRAFRFIRDQI